MDFAIFAFACRVPTLLWDILEVHLVPPDVWKIHLETHNKLFVCTLKRHNYRSQRAEGAPFKHSPVKTKTKSATPTHSKPKPLNHVVFNSCRDDGKHMHLERIHHHTDAHTFNNYFWNGTRGELHSHLMRRAEDFRLWNSKRADPNLGGAWWGWCGEWGICSRIVRGALKWALQVQSPVLRHGEVPKP